MSALHSPQWTPEGEKFAGPYLKIFNPSEPTNVIAVNFVSDESRGVESPRSRTKLGKTPSSSTVAMGVGVLMGYEAEVAALADRAAEIYEASGEFMERQKWTQLQGFAEIILAINTGALAALAPALAREGMGAGSKGGGVPRYKIHAMSRA